MDNGTLVAANHHIAGRRPGLRRASVLAVAAVVLALVMLVPKPADAAPRAGSAAGVSAQIDFRQIVCPILTQIRASFSSSPFFGAVNPIIDDLLVAFGCIGGTTTTVAPTTTTTVAPTTTTTVFVPPTTIVVPTIPGINFGQITCPILLATRASFANSPFFAGSLPVIDQLIAAFGCTVSG